MMGRPRGGPVGNALSRHGRGEKDYWVESRYEDGGSQARKGGNGLPAPGCWGKCRNVIAKPGVNGGKKITRELGGGVRGGSLLKAVGAK